MQFVVGEQQLKVGYFINNLVYMQCIYVYASMHALAALNISYDLLLYTVCIHVNSYFKELRKDPSLFVSAKAL